MNRPDKEMKQGRVFSCQITHFCAKCIWNKIIQVILLIFNHRFWFSLLFLNFSDLCEGEVEGQRLIFLSFFIPQTKERERREMGEKCLCSVSFHISSDILFLPLFWLGTTVKEKVEAIYEIRKEQRFLSFIYSCLFCFPSFFLQAVKRWMKWY